MKKLPGRQFNQLELYIPAGYEFMNLSCSFTSILVCGYYGSRLKKKTSENNKLKYLKYMHFSCKKVNHHFLGGGPRRAHFCSVTAYLWRLSVLLVLILHSAVDVGADVDVAVTGHSQVLLKFRDVAQSF